MQILQGRRRVRQEPIIIQESDLAAATWCADWSSSYPTKGETSSIQKTTKEMLEKPRTINIPKQIVVLMSNRFTVTPKKLSALEAEQININY